MRRYWYSALSPRLTTRTIENGRGIIWISALHATCRIPGRSGYDSSSTSSRRKTDPGTAKVEKGAGLDLSLSRYKANEEKRGQRNIERKVRIQDLLPF